MTQQSHESYVEYGEIKGPSNLNFGLSVGGILCAIGLLRWHWKGAISLDVVALVVFGIVLMILAMLTPGILTHPNRIWMKFGLLLARIVNPVVMFAMFILVFVPVGIFMRMFKRDALRLTREPGTASYWVEKQPPGPPANGIINQF
jgi:hypothetical protein